MSDQQVAPTPHVLFCSYADADQRLKQELEKHLKILLDQHLITFWGHDQIQLGSETAQVIQEQLFSASVFLLLLSPDFFTSDQCQRDMEHALERQRTGTARVFLILVRPCLWDIRLQDLPILPELTEPVTLWRNRDQAWLAIVRTLCQYLSLSSTAFAARRPAIFQVRALPATYVPRPAEFNAVKRLLLSETSAGRASAITTALRGAGGFGKTTLAQALCHDPDIQATFADGILWITLGEKPPNPLSLLHALITSLTGKRANVNTLEQAEARLRDLLEPRSCLIVLDDVWSGTDLTPFLEGGPHCARLITTRDTSVLPATSERVLVDAMRKGEAIQLLCQGLPDSIHQQEYAAALSALVTGLGEWPLLLTLANGALRDRIENHQDLQDALADLCSAYEAEGVVAFDKANTNQRNAAIERSLAVSLKLLSRSESLRYQELAIFPEDVDIPLATVEKLWQATDSLDLWKVKKLCLRLSGLSLLLSCDLGSQAIRLHDVLRNYLQQKAATHLARIHQAFLNAYHLPTWGELPLEEPYLWQHLFFHLKAAGRVEELLTTAQDFRYLAKEAFLLGSHAIEADLLEARTLVPYDQALARLQARIVQIGHLLSRSATLVDAQCLFLNYLCDLEHYREQCAALEKPIDGVYVKACHTLAALFPSTLCRTLKGHTHEVNGCAISADGEYIVSASLDMTLKVWKRESGELLHTLRGHVDSVLGCAISADGKYIVSASLDMTLKVWDRDSGELLHTLRGHTIAVVGCAISADGKYIVSASLDMTLKVWERDSGELLHTLRGHRHHVQACAISADGKYIVSASEDRTLKVWERESGELLHTLHGHTDWVTACAISGDGKYIVSASANWTLKIWERESGELMHTLQGYTRGGNGCAISGDGKYIVSTSWDKTLKIWERESGELLHTLRGHTGGIYGCVISADGKYIVSASVDKTLKIWEREGGETQHSLQRHARREDGCAISADGKYIVSASNDETLKIRERETKGLMHTFQRHPGLDGCVISPDAKNIISASGDWTLKIWERESGKLLHTLRGHTHKVKSCAISADGKYIVSASYDDTLKIWERESGELVRTLEGHTSYLNGCAISADGKYIVSASADKTLKIWERETGELMHTLQGHPGVVNGCAISADGKYIVSTSWDGTLKIWERESGELVRTLEGHTGGVNGCAISADGKYIVSASHDKTLKVWERGSGEMLHTLRGHTGGVHGCAISADGKYIISVSGDMTLKVWEMQSGNYLCTLFLETPLNDIRFSAGNPYFAVAGEAGVYFFQLMQGNVSAY